MPGEVLELANGRHRALIGRRGASLLRLQDDDLDLVHPAPLDADPGLACGVTLAPWPNRVRGAHWWYQERSLQLAVTEPAAGNALHGLVAATDFTVRDRRPEQVRLTTRIEQEPGYPFLLDLQVTYTLGDGGLQVEQAVQNVGAEAAPVALGAHPYLCLGEQDVATLDVEVSARTTLLLGDDHLPLDQMSVLGTPYDLRRGSPVGQMPGHAVYTDFAGQMGIAMSDPAMPTGAAASAPGPTPRNLHHLRGRGTTLELWTEPRLRWLQVYRTTRFPVPGGADGADGVVTALAVEPMTAPPDALNSGIDLEWVAPGSRWGVTWGLRLLRRA